LRIRKPFIQDFARLNFTFTLLSKRKLQWFVDNGKVTGWDDPRFPTIQGFLRRGLTVEAMKEFVLAQGASKSLTLMEPEKLWAINKKIIDPIIPRYTAIAAAGKCPLHLQDGPKTPTFKTALRHKKNPGLGDKIITYSSTIFLENKDAATVKVNEEITLMDWGNVIIDSIEKNESNDAVKMVGHLHLEGSVKDTEKKLTWLADIEDLVQVTLVDFDYLITKKKLEKDDKPENFCNPNSQFFTEAVGDPNLRTLCRGDKIQLERRGYFIVDQPYLSSHPMVLFQIPDGHTSKSQSVVSETKSSVSKKEPRTQTKKPQK